MANCSCRHRLGGGTKLGLWFLWGLLCVTYHQTADEPEQDTSHKKHATDVAWNPTGVAIDTRRF